ncbi:MAG: lysophospholipase [Limnothrix sp. RL_2_0]|nr:lysophospholipase [Limnothrix sp. RL_2_0]
MTAFIWIGAANIVLYFGICLLLYFGQQYIIFEPRFQLRDPVPADLPLDYETVAIPTGDDQTLTGWWFPCAESDGKTVLFFHGNGGFEEFNFRTITILHCLGFAVLAFNYRGYGRSEGKFPNEKRVYEDACAGYDFLRQRYRIQPNNLLLYGHSLGGAIAIELATRYPVAGLFLESTFASMLEMSITKTYMQFFPIDRILNQRFDSRYKIPHLRIPIFFCHGTADETVPSFMSPRLMAIANEPKHLIMVEGADHHNLPAVGSETLQEGIQWLCQKLQWQN